MFSMVVQKNLSEGGGDRVRDEKLRVNIRQQQRVGGGEMLVVVTGLVAHPRGKVYPIWLLDETWEKPDLRTSCIMIWLHMQAVRLILLLDET